MTVRDRGGASEDESPGRGVRASVDGDQAASDGDQTASEHDQTAGDRDQTSADRDQTASDSDQRSSDEDQEAADDDLEAGSDQSAHARTTRARRQATEDREVASEARDETGVARFAAASDRDRAALDRDRAAEARDLAAHRRDRAGEPPETRGDVISRAGVDRQRAAADRQRAAVDRQRAAEDRVRAAADREAMTVERSKALRMAAASAVLLQQATMDELTGTRTRFLGLDEASRELNRARRTGAPLTVAFVDLNGLKKINDTHGHLAGDDALRIVGETLRVNLRPYDVIIRFGGDEFVCVLSNCEIADAKRRFEMISLDLAATDTRHTLSVGLAQAESGDTLHGLIERADADLLTNRNNRRGPVR